MHHLTTKILLKIQFFGFTITILPVVWVDREKLIPVFEGT